jgi:hypothetical protein
MNSFAKSRKIILLKNQKTFLNTFCTEWMLAAILKKEPSEGIEK